MSGKGVFMRKENRVLWKIILIVLCTVCLIWLIKKDRTDFQIKQPKGDGIRKEEAVVLLQSFLETLDEGTYRETDGNGGTGSDIIELQTWMQELKKEENLKENLAYGEYEKLLSGFPKETGNSTGQINQMKEK